VDGAVQAVAASVPTAKRTRASPRMLFLITNHFPLAIYFGALQGSNASAYLAEQQARAMVGQPQAVDVASVCRHPSLLRPHSSIVPWRRGHYRLALWARVTHVVRTPLWCGYTNPENGTADQPPAHGLS
jgi:hypothetical protein